jgi:flagellar export protein FliJ
MQRFSFRLESVRALREQTETQAQHALAQELVVRDQRARTLDAATHRAEDARRAVAPMPGTAADAHDLVRRQAYVERTHRDAMAAHAGLAAQEVQVADRRVRLQDAARDREALERLKRSRQAEHEQSVRREEEAQLGEVAIAAHRRRHSGGRA